MNAGKWTMILPGWYRYTNSAGKTLAYAERYRSFWNVTVLPMADAAQAVKLSESPKTLCDAKGLAERSYGSLTRSALIRQNEAVAKHTEEVSA